MNCPFCSSPSSVLETRTRKADGTIRRTRICAESHKFTTEERAFMPTLGAPRATLQTIERRLLVRKLIAEGKADKEIERSTGASRRTIARLRVNARAHLDQPKTGAQP